jgi:hypothetical protein
MGLIQVGCGWNDRIPPTGPTGPSLPAAIPTSPTTIEAKPDFVFETVPWHEEWTKDRDAAKVKYVGKLIELTGEVVFVHLEWDGLNAGPGGMVNLKDEKRGAVTCITTDPQPWLTVSEGSTVRLRGRSGKRDGEELADCSIVEAGPNPAITATAEEIAKAVAADLDAADQKYNKKFAHVSGTVSEVLKDTDGTVSLMLKGAGEVEVRALMGRPAVHRAGPIKAGQVIALFCEVLIPVDPKLGVSLSQCVVNREPAK